MYEYAKSLRSSRPFPGVAELTRIGELVTCLAWRDLRARYKQSMLGVLWALVHPFSMMLVFTLVLGPQVGKSLPDGVPYSLFVFAGLVPWSYFSSSLMQCVNSLVANRNLVTKLYFPREAFPISCIATSSVDFAVGLAALVALMFYCEYRGTWSFHWNMSLLSLPVLVLIQTVLTAGLGMMVAMGNLFYRDIRPMLTVALQIGLFVSCVVIPPPGGSSWTSQIINANPVSMLLSGYRECLLHGRWPDFSSLSMAAIFAVFILAAGWSTFRRSSFRFAECI